MTHHPDRNPKDPEAHSKFASISSAYQVLSNTGKRARYDHEHRIHRPLSSSGKTNTHSRGSYVGSRPPSGLSKQRGPFRGPPPSFYAHGGYGPGRSYQQANGGHHASSSSSKTKTSPDPTSFIYNNTVPHFDASSHFRRQTQEDTRRQERRSKAIEEEIQARRYGNEPPEVEESMALRFFLVVGILSLAGLATNHAGNRLEQRSYRSKASTKSDNRDQNRNEA